MSDPYLSAFLGRVRAMEDDALVRTLSKAETSPQAYRPEALAAMREEVTRRGLTPDDVAGALQRWHRETVENLAADARDLALDGRSQREIASRLRGAGVDPGTATSMATQASRMPADDRRAAGRRNMLVGGAICGIALLVTASSWYVAAANGGGRYALWWGLMLIGGLQFVRGLDQVTRRE